MSHHLWWCEKSWEYSSSAFAFSTETMWTWKGIPLLPLLSRAPTYQFMQFFLEGNCIGRTFHTLPHLQFTEHAQLSYTGSHIFHLFLLTSNILTFFESSKIPEKNYSFTLVDNMLFVWGQGPVNNISQHACPISKSSPIQLDDHKLHNQIIWLWHSQSPKRRKR